MEAVLSQAGLPAEWEEVLRQIEDALSEAEAATAERERELREEASFQSGDSDPEVVWRQRLEHWDALVEGLQAFADKAEQKVAETSAALREGEEALRGWLKTAQLSGRNLADWEKRRKSHS